MKMVRTACNIAALVMLAGRTLPAQQEPLFGLESTPKGTGGLRKIPLVAGSWSIPVSGRGTTRLIQIVGLGPDKNITAELACLPDVKPVQNITWIVAKGECLLRFKPDGSVGSGLVSFTVLAAALASSKITGPLTEDQLAGADHARALIALESSGSESGSNGNSTPALADQLRPAILIFFIVLVVAIIAVLFFFKNKRGGPSAATASSKNEFDKEEVGHNRRQASAPSPSTGKTPIQDVLRELRQQDVIRQTEAPGEPEGTLSVESRAQGALIEETLTEHSKLLLDIDSRGKNLETRIEAVADQCMSMLTQATRQADDRQLEIRNDTTRRMHELENSIATIQRELSGHLASQSSRLQDLFKDLPTLADLNVTARVINKSDLSRLEDNLVTAAKRNALPSERLEALQDESSGLLDAIQEFVRTAKDASRDHTKKRLGRVVESATAVNHDLFSLGQLAGTQKHGFFVEMSLLEQNPLAKDLAAALTRETVKLGDPEGYYLKRLEALKANACVAGIDLADLDVDPERRNVALQQAVAKLLQTMGMTLIDPRQNDRLQAAEHQVVQFVRRAPGVQPGAIAHTMARGLQRGGEVIRKASVFLYE